LGHCIKKRRGTKRWEAPDGNRANAEVAWGGEVILKKKDHREERKRGKGGSKVKRGKKRAQTGGSKGAKRKKGGQLQSGERLQIDRGRREEKLEKSTAQRKKGQRRLTLVSTERKRRRKTLQTGKQDGGVCCSLAITWGGKGMGGEMSGGKIRLRTRKA